MANKIQFRRDTAANWATANPTLASGELAYETDTKKYKMGDGSTAWNGLPYFQDLFNTIFSPEAYGAKGDGTTDDTAAITAAINAANAKNGTVSFRAKTYKITSTLPVYAGINYRGVPPVQIQTVTAPGPYIADGAPTFVGGTLLVGDGTFAAFEVNATDLAAPASTVGATQLSSVQFYGLGLDNFTYGIHVGAKNVMGLVYGKIDEIYIRNCSQWGIKLVNFVHMDIGCVFTYLCQNGQYYGAQMDAGTYQGGNTNFRELFTLLPQDTRDRRLCRGIVFEAMGGTGSNGGAMNEIQAQRIQHNSYNKTLLTVTATLTSGSTAIAVPDGTKFLPGMIVTFTTTNYGFTLGQAYVVQSVAGNNLTLGGSRTGAVITPSGSGTLTLNTYGFPCVEVTAADVNSHVTSTFINHIDVEGTSSAGLYLENPTRCEFGISSAPNTTLVDIIGRNVGFTKIKSEPIVSTDFDANSTSSEFWGNRKASFQRYLKGLSYDSSISTSVLQIGGGNNNQNGGDIQLRSGFAYPSGGMGERIFPRDSAITLGGVNCGDLIFNGSANQTWTLPTIVTDSGSSNLAGSHVGLVFDILHYGAGTLTIATDGTQLMNKIAGRTSTTLTAGNGLKFIAARDNSGNLFWAVKTVTLLA